MADYITRIRTESGDLPVDYNALANLPQSDATLTKSGRFADAKAVGDKINYINSEIKELNSSGVSNSITINEKPLTGNINLIASDVGAADAVHEHTADDITEGTFDIDRIPVIPMDKGGTNANNGRDGLSNLLSSGAMILSNYQYGNSLPTIAEEDQEKMKGRIFFVKVQ